MGLKAYVQNLWRAFKGVPFPTQGGGGDFLTMLPWGTNGGIYPNSQFNWAQEVGPLTNSSLVMVAANWAGTNLPEAPLQVVREVAPGQREPVASHPLVDLFRQPTPYYSGATLWKAAMLSWIADGNIYLRKVRNVNGEPVELWYEPHFSIRPRWSVEGADFISYYEVWRNGQWYPIDPADVIHIRYGIDPYNPRLGLSPVASAYREIFTDSERARYSALILKNGGAIPIVLSPKESDTEVDAAGIKAEFEYRTTGDNVGRPIVLSGPMDATQFGATPDKLLVDKASIIPEERIAALVGIPAAVLGFGAGLAQTKVGATMKELREQAYENFIIPTQRLIASDLTVQLLSDWARPDGLRVDWDLSQVRVLQDDQTALATRQATLYEKGVITRAEARRPFGLPVTPADDVYFTNPGAAAPVPPPTPTGIL